MSKVIVSIPISLLISLPVAAQIVPANDGTNTQTQTNGNQTDIFGGTRSSNGANLFHSFDQFNLAPSQIANIQSNPALRNIFMRINGSDPSIIHGLLQVSGGQSNLFLINPSGILFGKEARLNLPGTFSATTATGIQFENGTLNVIGTPNYANLNSNPTQFIFALSQPGAIANFGQLSVRSGQSLSLIGGSVLNLGSLSAPGGQITLASVPGSQNVRLSQTGNVMSLEFQNPTESVLSNWNSTTLSQLLARGSALRDATELTMTDDGKIQLSGSALTISNQAGTTIASGTIAGETIQILGDRITLSSATIRADHNGTVLIGGDVQGTGTLPRATTNVIDQQSQIFADGGKIVVWSDQSAQFSGQAQAREGFIEISGKQQLGFAGRVDAGTSGTVLFDPENIILRESELSALGQETLFLKP
ncbi:filamentous hemagglutinin N-terminal domain-containing protein, partial [Pseudanabaenaceae cyanobacterium LEGE 13415]|nr:filamentous hemagglutinin N-terminal domain-containing protein [Pseudanabaenaceae cyanobacterium LEGE 13415]